MKTTKRYLLFPLIAATALSLSACAGAGRSTRGLDSGQLEISYIPPYSGTARLGIVDNFEIRYSIWFEAQAFDLYLHTNNESNLFNYGLVVGEIFPPGSDQKNSYYVSAVLGSNFKHRYYPYITYTHYTDFVKIHPKMWDLSFGCEIIVYTSNSKQFQFRLTPEFIIAPYFDDYPLNTPVVATIGLGFIFDLTKL